MEKEKTIILGSEYDATIRKKLRKALELLGATIGKSNWGVGGSQEIMQIDANLMGSILHIEAETYIGLTITGKSDLVDQVIASMKSFD
jgi:hypothetical protein